MAAPQRDSRAIRRRMRLEAGAWGALVALNTAFISLLLISRGAEAFALAIYASGASVFGLGTGLLGALVAARTGDVSRVTLAALTLARIVFVAVSLLLAITSGGALPLLVATLLIWTAGEGMALPVWTAYLASLSDPAERGRWFADRAAAAAVGAAVALLPMLLLVRLTSTERSLQAVYLVAALAALMSTLQVRALFRLAPSSPPPRPRPAEQSSSSPGLWFLGGVFCFWFGAALNRPVLPPYVVHQLHAPAGYFATAAVVAAVTGAGLQRWWGEYGNTRGTEALLGLSGLGAGVAPLLWAAVPDYRLGIPLEAAAAGCWLGHLLGLTLHAVELGHDDGERASVIARTQLAQGSAAALAPLIAAAFVGRVGTIPILIASGVICLGSTAIMTNWVRLPSDLPAVLLPVLRLQLRRGPLGSDQVVDRLAWLQLGNESVPDARREFRVRARLPVVLKQALSADCSSCRGLGCATCYGTGLG